MSHVVHPYAHRLGIIRDWKSRWIAADPKKYREFLKCDLSVREYLQTKLRTFYVSAIEVERSAKTMRIIIKTSRPGMIIGKSGEGAVKLREDILKFITKNKLAMPPEFKLDIEEVRSPESNAAIVAYMVAEGLEKRLPFRRVVKQMIDKVMANRDVKGVKIYLTGRLGGADMARQEELKKGQIPLQTFRADIDYAREKAHMTYGDIGIKVWIYRGEIFAGKGTDKAALSTGGQGVSGHSNHAITN
jgi:small subunit ribosomal protein S3